MPGKAGCGPVPADRAKRMLDAYVRDDMTFCEIGLRFDRHSSSVRQFLMSHDKTLIRLAQRRRKARRRLTRMVNRGSILEVLVCRLCGAAFEGRSDRAYCSPMHQKVWMILRYQIDRDARETQRTATARYMLKTGKSTAYAERYLAGEVGTEGTRGGFDQRWLVRGSLVHHWAIRAYVLDWPVFEQFHADVQQQIREYVAGEAAA